MDEYHVLIRGVGNSPVGAESDFENNFKRREDLTEKLGHPVKIRYSIEIENGPMKIGFESFDILFDKLVDTYGDILNDVKLIYQVERTYKR